MNASALFSKVLAGDMTQAQFEAALASAAPARKRGPQIKVTEKGGIYAYHPDAPKQLSSEGKEYTPALNIPAYAVGTLALILADKELAKQFFSAVAAAAK